MDEHTEVYTNRNAALRLETVAAFIWNAYRRPRYPGWPEWKDASEVQRRACENDAQAILTALDVLEARDGCGDVGGDA